MSFVRIAVGCAAVWSCWATAAQACEHRQPRSLDVDLTGIEQIQVKAGPGDLVIRGESGRVRLVASGEACAGEQQVLEKLQLTSERHGDTLLVSIAEGGESMTSGLFNGPAYLNLEMRVPETVAIIVKDGSGNFTASGVGRLELDDGSGDVDISDVHGPLQVHDGSGSIRVAKATGVQLSDGSGDVELRGIQGNVDILDDGSGNLFIRDVSGNVRVRNDGSGDISLEHIGRDVRVDDDGSGEIVARDVGGSFTVAADGSGGIRHEQIRGAVKLP